MVCREEEARRFEDAKLRIREKYQKLEASKRDRQLIFTDNLPPEKRRKFDGAWGWGATRPKTLFEKARSSAKKITNVYRGPPASASSASSMDPSSLARTSTPYPLIPAPKSKPVQRPMANSPTAHRSLLHQIAKESEHTQQRPAVVVKTTTKTVPIRIPPTSHVRQADRPNSSIRPHPQQVNLPASKLAAREGANNVLFMPKNRAHSQLPSRAKA